MEQGRFVFVRAQMCTINVTHLRTANGRRLRSCDVTRLRLASTTEWLSILASECSNVAKYVGHTRYET